MTPRKRVAKLATNRLHVRQLGQVAFGPPALAVLILVLTLGTTARAHAQAPPTITASYDPSEYVVAEGASVTVTVALSEGPLQSTEIPLAVQSGGTAAAGDYGGVPSSLTFAVGETAKSFTFTATDESDAEMSETVVLGFGTLPDGVTGGATSTVTIVDNDNGVNILLITADDLNWDSVGAFGSLVEGATPNLDPLAAAGMRFEHAHVMVAVCTPSRSAVMTGRYPNLSGGQGFHDLRMEGVPILPVVLRSAGYTVGVLGRVNASTPYDETTFEWDMAEAKDLGKERNPEAYYSRMKTFVQGATEEGRPFFLMVNSADPHRRFYGNDPDEWYDDLDPPAAVPSRTFSADEVAVPGFLPDLPEVRLEIAEYYGSVRRLDDLVGRVLDALDETGVAANTIVTFISDNGMAFPFAKKNVYLNSTRTPLIMRWPGVIEPGSVDSDHMISAIDYLPTVLDAAGVTLPDGVNGSSALPLLRGEMQEGRDRVFTQHDYHSLEHYFQGLLPMRSVQSRKFGYIFNAWADGTREFTSSTQSGRSRSSGASP